MFERYTERARRALFFARFEASLTGCTKIEPEHLLLGLLVDTNSAAAALLPGLPSELVRHKLETQVTRPGSRIPSHVEIPFSAASKAVLQQTADVADALGHQHIGTEHLLLGILEQPDTFAAATLTAHGVVPEHVRASAANRTGIEGSPVDADDEIGVRRYLEEEK